MLFKTIIWGSSGHARVVLDILRLQGGFEVLGFIDDVNPDRRGNEVDGLKIFGGVEPLNDLKRCGVSHAVIGVGNCQARMRLGRLALEYGFELATAIHPKAAVATNARIGRGSVIGACAAVNPAASLGENVIVNTAATVDHECSIANGVHLSPGVHLGGLVTVDEGVWIGIGAVVRDRIRIGSHSIIGAGSVVTKDIPPGVLAYGVPARIIRELEIS